MQFRLRTLLILLPVIWVGVTGCSESIEQQLRLKYVPPKVPAAIPSEFRPMPGTRDEEHLQKGETTIDLRAAYLRGHRYGWKLAIDDWDRSRRFQYQTREDFQGWDDFPSTVDAIWIGYDEARRQIELASKNP
jgi:hypothetical protein